MTMNVHLNSYKFKNKKSPKIVQPMFLFSLLILLLTQVVLAQPTTQWSKTYGGSGDDLAHSMIQTADGGFAFTGYTTSYGNNYFEAWLVKTDADGKAQWNKTIGGTPHYEMGRSLIQTPDSGFIIAGDVEFANATTHQAWLIKTDSNGNTVWNQTYGGTNSDTFLSVAQTLDGGFIIAGTTKSYGEPNGDFWLLKTDSIGNHQWNHTYGGPGSDQALSVIQTSDQGYVLTGYTTISNDASMLLIKTDPEGHQVWNKTLGGANTDIAHQVIQTSDNGFAIAGYTMSTGSGAADAWLIKTDQTGNVTWSKTYGTTDEETANAIIQLGDGGFALAGYKALDAWLLRIDSQGNALWNKTYGGTALDLAESIVQTADGGFAFAGYTLSDTEGFRDAWIVKTATDVIPEFPPNMIATLLFGIAILAATLAGQFAKKPNITAQQTT